MGEVEVRSLMAHPLNPEAREHLLPLVDDLRVILAPFHLHPEIVEDGEGPIFVLLASRRPDRPAPDAD